MIPSLASRDAFLAAVAKPFLRRYSTAESKSPLASVKAFLQSSTPALVASRRSLTMSAVISAIMTSIVPWFLLGVFGDFGDFFKPATQVGGQAFDLLDHIRDHCVCIASILFGDLTVDVDGLELGEHAW